MQKHESAFTLIELMITIAVAAVVLTLGVPGFGRVIERNQLSAYTNQLVSSLHFARSEAVKRNENVKVCHSDNGTVCNGNGYEDGWIIFIENSPANDVLDAGEELIRVNEALPSNYTFRPNNNVDVFTYDGKGKASNKGTFVLCKNNDLTKARAVIIGPGGRTRLAPLNTNGIPEKEIGTPVPSC